MEFRVIAGIAGLLGFAIMAPLFKVVQDNPVSATHPALYLSQDFNRCMP
ncbi:MAG: hypothetical protein O2971_07085 [Proteobacteria bacterium]|nr:hypothetical protein [Pseudomonadota bacterium]